MSSKVPLRVLIIVASTRPGRLGPAIADWFVEAIRADAKREGIGFEVADLAEMALPFLDEPEHPSTGIYTKEHTRSWSRRVDSADAFVVVTPEYNYGMPAALKNAFDFLYHEWAWKPVAFISYGNTSAGTRSVQMSKQVVTTLKMMPIGATVSLRIADNIHNGRVRDNAALDQTARRVLDELTGVARAMRPLRKHQDRVETTPAPVDGLILTAADEDDLAELLVLQRCCWVQEALANDTLDLAPLHESLADVRRWVQTWQVWCVRRQGRLVAAVRARAHGTTWEIGRLMVAPDEAGAGIGSWLLAHAERQAPDERSTIAVFTGRRSLRNIALYRRAGYGISPSPTGTRIDTIYLTKPRHLTIVRR